MPTEERRAEIIDAYRASRAELLAAIDGLSEAELLERSIDGWSVKDHLAHISQWDELRFVDIMRVSAGLLPAVPVRSREAVDQFNALSFAGRQDWSLEQARAELDFTRARVLEAVTAASETALDQSNYRGVGLEAGAHHELEHADMIRTWRDSRRSIDR